MKIFLVQDVKNLGQKGEIKEVSAGYARNFLLAKGLAVLPNSSKAKAVLQEKSAHQLISKKEKDELETKAAALDGQTFIFMAKADKNGHLYGSIGPAELTKAIGLVENSLKNHFKTLGEFPLEIKFGNTTAMVKIVIKKEK